jgi:hypothetical protein
MTDLCKHPEKLDHRLIGAALFVVGLYVLVLSAAGLVVWIYDVFFNAG